jgi:hypothetical protein
LSESNTYSQGTAEAPDPTLIANRRRWLQENGITDKEKIAGIVSRTLHPIPTDEDWQVAVKSTQSAIEFLRDNPANSRPSWKTQDHLSDLKSHNDNGLSIAMKYRGYYTSEDLGEQEKGRTLEEAMKERGYRLEVPEYPGWSELYTRKASRDLKTEIEETQLTIRNRSRTNTDYY